MAFKINGDITLADIVSLGTALVVGLFVIFQYGAAIEANSQDIEDNAAEIVEVKLEHEKDNDKTFDAIKEQGKETNDKFDKVDAKLDTVIKHLIENN